MNKRIFRGISLTALAVLLLSMVVIFGALYGYFDNLQTSRLRTETALAAQGVRLSGRAYFENLEPGDYGDLGSGGWTCPGGHRKVTRHLWKITHPGRRSLRL